MDKESLKARGRKVKLILDSATFALLLSILLFSYEMISSTKETDQIVDNLMEIQGSLSTRYLGLFPEYIDNINSLLINTIHERGRTESRDSIIIFEDVLYYGIRSDAAGFRKMVENLVNLSNSGCHIMIAYYNPYGIPFKQMIRDNMIKDEYKNQYLSDIASYRDRVNKLRSATNKLNPNLSRIEFDTEIRGLLNQYFDNYFVEHADSHDSLHQIMRNIYNYRLVDSTLSQRYYEQTRKANSKRFKTIIKELLQPIPQKEDATDATSLRVNQLCLELDNIKRSYMDKPYEEIMYMDFHNMYRDISLVIGDLLKQQPNIELLPMNESLMMCCWMSSVNDRAQAIFAFPSKYSTDEIGFISQDPAIARYIRTMLKGVRGTHDGNKSRIINPSNN